VTTDKFRRCQVLTQFQLAARSSHSARSFSSRSTFPAWTVTPLTGQTVAILPKYFGCPTMAGSGL
jgi:hypothetical protein